MLAIILTFVVCGAIANPIDNVQAPRIIGGQAAYNGQFPYQASIRYLNGSRHFCGGSIIGGYWILTAAHCVAQVTPSEIEVVVGTNKINSGGWSYNVAAIHSHANFNPGNHINDIAVLQLNTQISGASTVQTVSLASSLTPSGARAVFSGWGVTSASSSELTYDLQYIYLNTITVSKCQELLPFRPVFDSNVCTHMLYGQGPCKGDNGGPLVINGVQHGISSWGIDCAKGTPDVFTSIPFYRNWIKTVTGI